MTNIREIIKKFTSEVDNWLSEMADHVGQPGSSEAPAAAPSNGRRTETRTVAAKPAKKPRKGGKTGTKRDPGDIEKLTERLFDYIKKHPNSRIEEIGKAMELSTKELALSVKKLIKAERIAAEGQKRATKYSPA
jgi:hypothetical protein